MRTAKKIIEEVRNKYKGQNISSEIILEEMVNTALKFSCREVECDQEQLHSCDKCLNQNFNETMGCHNYSQEFIFKCINFKQSKQRRK